MDLSLLWLAWLSTACLCLAAGIRLTRRRMVQAQDGPASLPGCCRCGEQLTGQERFCGRCGRRLTQSHQQRSTRDEA